MKLHLATLTLSLLLHTPHLVPTANAQECSGVELAFTLIDLTGTCTYETLLAEYTTQVYDKTGNTCRPPDLTAKQDFDAKLIAATGKGTGEEGGAEVCRTMYNDADQTPFNYAAAKGSPTDATDLHFEQMFYDGLGEWQDEVETLYEDPDGEETSRLRRDAAKVREFYEGLGSYSRVEWPESLTQFEPSTCTMNAAMCCWPKDRQAGDGNGNCATPYDENCVDKDPADNTNLCFSDLAKGEGTSNLNSTDGFMVFPEDGNNGEGDIHCHGFAWAEDEYDTISRYKANNLFFVSMYDHMHQRGYVKNIPGMPMCGCMDQMPIATRSDCTQVDLTEDYIMEYNGTSFVGTLTKVEIDFNACRGRNGRNNDLWAYAARLYDEGRMSAAHFGKVGRVLTNDHDCYHATEYAKQLKGYTTGYTHNAERETQVAGRDQLYMTPLGREAFNKAFFQQSLTAPGRELADTSVTALGEVGGSPIIHRVCPHCVDSHKHVYYRRLTAIPDGFDLMHNIMYHRSGAGQEGNRWNADPAQSDFTLHSTYDDAVSGDNAWSCPNDNFNYHVPFVGNCSPSGKQVNEQYSIWNWFPGPQQDVAYYVNKAENLGVQEYTDNTRAANLVDVDIGSPRLEGNTWEDNGVYHITGSGKDIWRYDDEFHYKAQQSGGDVDVSVHLTSFANNGNQGSAKAGIMLRATLDADSTYALGFLSYSYGVKLQRRLSKGAHANNPPGVGYTADPPQNASWLRLVKKMETVEFYYKVDEEDEWTLQQSETMFFPDDKFYVGLAVCSHHNDYLAEATFEDYSVDAYYFPTSAPSISSAPTPWTPLIEIGASRNRVGQFHLNADETIGAVSGTGQGIWGTEDAFTYYNMQEPNSDMTVEMYIKKFDNGYLQGRGGIMIRDTNAVDSAYVFLGAAGGDQGAVFQSRASSGAYTEHHKMVFVNSHNGFWVKLVKSGDLYTASFKENADDTYAQLGETISVVMPGSTVQVGRAATPGSDNTWAEVWLETTDYSVVVV